MTDPRSTRGARKSASRVKIRSMNQPKPGWTEEQAVDQVRQGYSADRIAQLSGFAAAFLRAQVQTRVTSSDAITG